MYDLHASLLIYYNACSIKYFPKVLTSLRTRSATPSVPTQNQALYKNTNLC